MRILIKIFLVIFFFLLIVKNITKNKVHFSLGIFFLLDRFYIFTFQYWKYCAKIQKNIKFYLYVHVVHSFLLTEPFTKEIKPANKKQNSLQIQSFFFFFFLYGIYTSIFMDHTFYSTSSSSVDRGGTSTFSQRNKRSSPYVGFSEYFFVRYSYALFGRSVD